MGHVYSDLAAKARQGQLATTKQRSDLMKRVRRTGTAPEVALRKALHRAGFRFRLNVRGLPGTPDIVLPRYRIAIFVHGCFWHGHGCRAGRLPKTNREYWEKKIQGNQERDERKVQSLVQIGYQVVVVWTCELTDAIPKLLAQLESVRSTVISRESGAITSSGCVPP